MQPYRGPYPRNMRLYSQTFATHLALAQTRKAYEPDSDAMVLNVAFHGGTGGSMFSMNNRRCLGKGVSVATISGYKFNL